MTAERSIRSYRDLRVWNEAMGMVEECYGVSAAFPRDEQYGLTSQLRRAAVSVPSKIAEGYGRDITGSYLQFLRIAQGSLKEVETLLLIAVRVSIVSEQEAAPVLTKCDDVGRMLGGLIRSLRADEHPPN